ncbi:MAG: glycoside hydrolase family 38 C-terminal domain-containing protein [Terriglobales bacterium]
MRCRLLALACLALAASLAAQAPGQSSVSGRPPVILAQVPKQAPPDQPDLTQTPTLFVVGYAHLDTEWRWDYPQVINEYLKATLDKNFALFQKYPHYIFNFTGANRFMMFQEYYPRRFQELKQYVAEGRWFPGGASMEENDVNSPNAESIIRQVLYGNEYFRETFGKAAVDYMLPDCFGFPAALPSILSAAGIIAFSTQKLNAGWQPAARVGGPDSPEGTPEGIPFNVGIWTGPDGKSIIAAVNPGSYDGGVHSDLSQKPLVRLVPYAHGLDAVTDDGRVSGIYDDYHYVGTGDIGGAPDEESVKIMEAIMDKGTVSLPQSHPRGTPAPPPGPAVQVGDGPIHVVWSDDDTMFLDMKNMDLSRLPRYTGDLELINHSAGSLTSEAAHKRWNRENEILAHAAEEASVGAQLLGRAYPQRRLAHAWRLLLGGQFHDLMAGTAEASAYTYSWNDDTIAANQFASVLTSSIGAVAAQMNVQTAGVPVVVFNALNIPRQDPVKVKMELPAGTHAVRVTGPDGRAVPGQLDNDGSVVFIASAPSIGYAVYSVAPAAHAAASQLEVSAHELDNARYRVQINSDGDVSSVYDKLLGKELLSGPMRLSFQTEAPTVWPAWNMDWDDQNKPPRAYVSGPAQIQVTEDGPARVTVQITRDSQGSHFVQTVSLAAGAQRVVFGADVDWKTARSALMADFPLTASNPAATYSWDIGTIQRGNDNPRQFEVASHEWVDLTNADDSYGATLLTDVKTGSDKPNGHLLRLTLLYTPGLHNRNYSDQATQDWGHHHTNFGLAGHAGDWRQTDTEWQAYRLNVPLFAFTSAKHPGRLGRSLSLLRVDNPRIRVLALKKAEQGQDVVVRLVELDGQEESNVHLRFATRVLSVREVNGQEQPIPTLGPVHVANGAVVAGFSAYQPRTFEVKLAPLGGDSVRTAAVRLPFDLAAATPDHTPSTAGFDGKGDSYPAEMLPRRLDYAGVPFQLADPSGPDAVIARGQTIALPRGRYTRLYLLASSLGDQTASFGAGGRQVPLAIENWMGLIGQWDYRDWSDHHATYTDRRGRQHNYSYQLYAGLHPGFIKRAPVAWFASHHHLADGSNDAYSYSYLFGYEINLPLGATTLTLPDNPSVRIFAATVAGGEPPLAPAHPLYDVLPYVHADRALLYTQSSGPDAPFYTRQRRR